MEAVFAAWAGQEEPGVWAISETLEGTSGTWEAAWVAWVVAVWGILEVSETWAVDPRGTRVVDQREDWAISAAWETLEIWETWGIWEILVALGIWVADLGAGWVALAIRVAVDQREDWAIWEASEGSEMGPAGWATWVDSVAASISRAIGRPRKASRGTSTPKAPWTLISVP